MADAYVLCRLARDIRCTLAVVLNHADGSSETINARHSYNAQQIGWFRAGSALNALSAGTEY